MEKASLCSIYSIDKKLYGAKEPMEKASISGSSSGLAIRRNKMLSPPLTGRMGGVFSLCSMCSVE